MRAVRAGAIVFLGIALANVGNYAFHVLAGRELGPARYGDLATLVAIVGLISLPLGGVQVWVARYVAQFEAVDDHDAVHWFVRRVGTYAAFAALAVTALFATLAWPVQQALGIASIAAVVLTALTALPSLASPVTWGLAQGLQRFGLVAAVYAAGPIVRIGLTVTAFAVGLHVGGAMLATLASMLVSLLLPLWVLRDWFRPAAPSGRRLTRGLAARSLVPVAVGLLAITWLTTIDLIVAKVVLSEHETGIYGSASLIGRVILYLPAAIITVLLPRVAARTAGRRESADLLGKSVAVTLAFCLGSTAVYAVASSLIVRIAFGDGYQDAAPLLWLFAVAMTFFAVLNVLLVYHLGRDDNRMAWLLAGGAVAQLAAFAVLHASARQLLAVDIGTALVLLGAHEAWLRPNVTGSLRTLFAGRRA